MAVKTSDRFFKEVDATSEETSEYTPGDGEVLMISEAYGQAGVSPDTVVTIIWDISGANQLIFCTHSSGLDSLVDFSVTGDGVKKLTMTLTNDQATADFFGVGWRN